MKEKLHYILFNYRFIGCRYFLGQYAERQC